MPRNEHIEIDLLEGIPDDYIASCFQYLFDQKYDVVVEYRPLSEREKASLFRKWLLEFGQQTQEEQKLAIQKAFQVIKSRG